MTRFLVELRADTSGAEQALTHVFRPDNLLIGVDEMLTLPALPNAELPFALQFVTEDLRAFQANAVVAGLIDIANQIPGVTALPARPVNRMYRTSSRLTGA